MPAAKKPAKVIDGVHAGAAPAAPTSRPLITNRPFMAMDPMLNPNQEAADSAEQSSNAAPKKSAATHAVDRTAKDIMPSADLTEATEKVDEVVEADEKLADTKEAAPAESTEPAEMPHADETDEHKPAAVSPPAEKPLKTTPSKTPDDEAEAAVDLKVDVPNTEEDAAAAQKLEIERHIAVGTYFVPIGQARRRRLAIAFIITCLLLATLVLLNILLDLDILTLNLPHTNFLNN